MSRVLRVWLSLICTVQLFFAVAFFFQWSPAIALWPLEGTTPLTFILLASFFAAAAASTLWPIVTGRAGALAGVGLDYVVILTPMAATFFVLAARGMRNAEGQATDGLRTWVQDGVTGLLIAAPVYWMFTKFLAINLPGLTQSGWL